jgi:hypothetical protein
MSKKRKAGRGAGKKAAPDQPAPRSAGKKSGPEQPKASPTLKPTARSAAGGLPLELPLLPWPEYLALGVAFLVLLLLGASTVVSSIAANNTAFPNDIIYMAAAIDTARSSVGSYGHILLLKFFLVVADPLAAAKIYWSFVIALTTVLVYVNARILSQNATPFNGVLAVYLFFASVLVFKFSGVLFAECTLMLLVMLGVTVYLLYQRLTCCRRGLLITLGVMVLLALQTKLIGGCLLLLLVGLKWNDDTPLDWPAYAKQLGMVAAGAVGGLLVMILLFGNTLSVSGTHQALVTTTTIESPMAFRVTWYWLLSFRGGVMLLVALYLVALVKTGPRWMEHSNAVVWGLPLAVLLVLPATTPLQNVFWEERHFFVLLPITSMLAAQSITIKPGTSLQTYARYLGAIGGALLVVWAIQGWIFANGARLGWESDWIQRGFVFPIGLTLLFALLILSREWNSKTIFVAFFCLFLMTMQPLSEIPAIMRQNNDVSRTIFYPYAQFAEDITYTDDMKVYISPDIYNEYSMLSNDSEVCEMLFSVFFDARTFGNEFSLEQLVFLPDRAYFTYIFLTSDNWGQFSPEQKQTIETIYHIKTDAQNKLVLGAARGAGG